MYSWMLVPAPSILWKVKLQADTIDASTSIGVDKSWTSLKQKALSAADKNLIDTCGRNFATVGHDLLFYYPAVVTKTLDFFFRDGHDCINPTSCTFSDTSSTTGIKVSGADNFL